MQSVSAAFTATLARSHTKVARVDLYRGREVILEDVPIISGSVTDDSQAVIRRRMTVALAASTEVLAGLAATAPADGGLWPLGNELRVRAGLVLPDGTEETVPQGVYRISKPVLSQSAQGVTVQIQGFDRARSVSRARFTEPYVIAQGTNYADAIKDLVLSRLATLDPVDDFVFLETNYTTPQLVFTADDDPMAMALQMAGSLGCELFFDGDGRCVLRREPDPLYDDPVAYYSPGVDATLTAVDRDLDDEQAYNGVIVTSENSELAEPLRAEAWDTNPNSPTYYDPEIPAASLYGAVPYFISSQFITTQEQAQDAADANLARVLGVIEQVQFNAITNPAHESGDIVAVTSEDIGAEGVNILDAITTTFGTAVEMQGTTRKRRTA